MTDEIKTVVFDIGNVLVRWEIHNALPSCTPVEIQRFLTEFDFHEFNLAQDAGRPAAEAFAQLANKSPDWLPYVKEYLANFSAAVSSLEPGMEELIRTLKASSYQVYGLTNWAADRWEIALANIPAIALFDGVVVSGFEGICKPDLRIYELLLTRFNIDPKHALFIDDRSDNCAAAEQLGMRSFQFHPGDANKLAVELGILVE